MENENFDPNLPHVEPEPETDKEKKKKNAVKYIINISLVLIITVIALVVSLWGDKFQAAVDNLKSADWKWLLVTLAIMASSVLVKALIDFCFARLNVRKYHYHQALAVDEIDTFYAAVTPGATGGQVMVSYTFAKQGVPVSSAVSVVAMMSILYQVVLVGYGILAFAIKANYILTLPGLDIKLGDFTINLPMIALTLIGFFMNTFFIAAIFLMAYWRKFHQFILGPCVSFLNKIHILKNPDKTRESLRITVENFKLEFRRLLTNIPFTILAIVLFIVFFTVRFSIPYFCGLALNNQSPVANFWDAVLLSNYHQMVTSMIPIPGSAGVSELFFSTLFVSNSADTSFFVKYAADGSFDITASKGLCSAAMLLWRTVTFTLPLIIAGIVTAFYKPSKNAKSYAQEIPEMPTRQTFLTMQEETYLERQRDAETLIETRRLSKEAIMKKLKSHKKEENIPLEDEIMSIDIGEEEKPKKHWWNKKK